VKFPISFFSPTLSKSNIFVHKPTPTPTPVYLPLSSVTFPKSTLSLDKSTRFVELKGCGFVRPDETYEIRVPADSLVYTYKEQYQTQTTFIYNNKTIEIQCSHISDGYNCGNSPTVFNIGGLNVDGCFEKDYQEKNNPVLIFSIYKNKVKQIEYSFSTFKIELPEIREILQTFRPY
jgi:hypothetical protein